MGEIYTFVIINGEFVEVLRGEARVIENVTVNNNGKIINYNLDVGYGR